MLPALDDDRAVITQPLAIVEYHDEGYPKPSLLPGVPPPAATPSRADWPGAPR
ncbi:MAG: hypothetical protein JJU27_19440 [Gammaproteobacteria bacterium]|nr:hypothetical protein [Gammaproteobacteria bacterium]